jgi:biofilm PGA synthesis N-glycosyltransferase PgaC
MPESLVRDRMHMPRTGASYAIITPARNEGTYLPRTIESLVAQTHRPVEWIIVDDGSTDDTAALVERAAAEHDWIHLVRAPDRGARIVGAGVVEAFNLGLAASRQRDTAFLCKLDADLVLPPDYFERLFGYFAADPRLGIACGPIVEQLGGKAVPLRHNPDMVFGAAKCYRRRCFDEIGGIELSIGWDGIDCYQAMRRGWRTHTIPDPALEMLHLRRMGSSHKNVLHGFVRRGRGLRYNGAHPAWVLANTAYRMFERPYILAGLSFLFGYLDATIRRAPRIPDKGFITYLRHWQLDQLRRMILRRSRDAVATGHAGLTTGAGR